MTEGRVVEKYDDRRARIVHAEHSLIDPVANRLVVLKGDLLRAGRRLVDAQSLLEIAMSCAMHCPARKFFLCGHSEAGHCRRSGTLWITYAGCIGME